MLRSLLSDRDIHFLNKSFNKRDVISFCLWIEDEVLSQLLPEFSLKKVINDVTYNKKQLLQNATIESFRHIFPNNFMDNLMRLLNKKRNLFLAVLDFLYNPEILAFYRRLSMILSPIVELDIITIIKKIKKKSLSREHAKKLEERARLEFAYWAERIITSWYKYPTDEEISIKNIPIGPIAEYDLMVYVMMEFPEKYYWNQEDGYGI
jgi:hypothetical protein